MLARGNLIYRKTLARICLANRLGKIQICCLWGEELLLTCLGTLCTILGAGLHTALYALGIQSAADDVVTHTGKVLNTTTANQNYRVLLQVMADTRNVSGNFHAIGQTHTGDLTQCGVRLLGAGDTNSSTYATLLGGRYGSSLVLQGVQGRMQSRSKYGAKRPKAGKK